MSILNFYVTQVRVLRSVKSSKQSAGLLARLFEFVSLAASLEVPPEARKKYAVLPNTVQKELFRHELGVVTLSVPAWIRKKQKSTWCYLLEHDLSAKVPNIGK